MSTKNVFISHSTQDKLWADQLCNALESAGISCWIAPRDIQPGQSWADAIVAGIKGCQILILLLSENSMDSRYVHREVELADANDKVLLTAKLDDVQPSGGLEFFIRLPQSVNCLRKAFDKCLLAVVNGVVEYLPDFDQDDLTSNVPQLWQTMYQDGLVIVMGRFTNHSLTGWERSGLAGSGDVMALAELNSYLSKLNIINFSVVFADQLHDDLLANNLVLLGGDVNAISMRFVDKIKPKLTHGYGVTFIDYVEQKKYIPVGKNDKLITDYGLMIYADNPFAENRKVLYIAGSFGFGTWGGVRHAISYQFLQNPLVRNGEAFESLIEVSVENEAVNNIQSLIMRPLSSLKNE